MRHGGHRHFNPWLIASIACLVHTSTLFADEAAKVEPSGASHTAIKTGTQNPSTAAATSESQAVVTDTFKTTLASTTIDAKDADLVVTAALADMGNSCIADSRTSPRVANTLKNIQASSESIVNEFKGMIRDEISEKKGPLKIGPPEFMNSVIVNTSNLQAYTFYDNAKNHNAGRSYSPAKTDRAKVFEDWFFKTFKSASKDDLAHATELSMELEPAFAKPLGYPTRGRGGPWKTQYLGVSRDPPTSQKYFSSLEDVAPALGEMNEFLRREAISSARDKAMTNALISGLALSFPSALIGAAKAVAAQKGLTIVAGGLAGAAAPVAAEVAATATSTAATLPIKTIFFSTILTSMQADLANTFKNFGSGKVMDQIKIAAGTVDANPLMTPIAGATAKATQSHETTGLLSLNDDENAGSDAHSKTSMMQPSSQDPSALVTSMQALRKITDMFLYDPSTTKSSANMLKASSASEEINGTINDTKATNDDFLSLMLSFHNQSRQSMVDVDRLSELNSARKSGGAVSSLDLAKISQDLNPDVSSMLLTMDNAVSKLGIQAKHFAADMEAIEKACNDDALRIYKEWGTHRMVWRDKLGLSPTGGPVSPAKAYLAEATLNRADCVYKKSVARQLEMMRGALVLSQFKANCETLKNWDRAARAYKSTYQDLQKSAQKNKTPNEEPRSASVMDSIDSIKENTPPPVIDPQKIKEEVTKPLDAPQQGTSQQSARPQGTQQPNPPKATP